MSLLLLSISLLHEIFLFLSPRNIRACRQTCKGFSNLVGDSLLLQYILSRENSCVVDIPSSDTPVNCRLEILQRWERAWDVLRMRTLARDVPCPEGKGLPYVICDNFLIGMRINPPTRFNPPHEYHYLSIYDPTFSSSPGNDNWTRVDLKSHGMPITWVFATELNMTVIVSTSR
jgi:F-box domain